MTRKAIGFYWTLPVPWARFTSLPEDVDEAAKASQTIAYQREVIRAYAKENGYELVREKVFLEIEPDRGTDLIWAPLDQAAGLCRDLGADLILVDFSEVQGWRRHGPLKEWIRKADIGITTIFPDEIIVNGRYFDPHSHFSTWKDRQRRWVDEKGKRSVAAGNRIAEMISEGFTYSEIADSLNSEGVFTPTGKIWTKDNVQKFNQQNG